MKATRKSTTSPKGDGVMRPLMPVYPGSNPAYASTQLSERIICAAFLLPDGYIVRGHRHHDAIRSLMEMERGKGLTVRDITQGFVTSTGRFVGRAEAHRIHFGTEGQLFSEDVY